MTPAFTENPAVAQHIARLKSLGTLATILLIAVLLVGRTKPVVDADQGAIVSEIRKSLDRLGELSALERIREIRRWVYRNTDVASRPFLLDDKTCPINSLPLDAVYVFYSQDQGGHFCGGIADVLAKTYRALGYESYSLHYGERGQFTHATTLVRVQGKLYLEDAYFNYRLVDDQGNVLDFNESQRRLTLGLPVEIQEDDDLRDVHVTHPKNSQWAENSDPEHWRIQPDGHYVCQAATRVEPLIRRHRLVPRTYDLLAQQGLPPDVRYLILFPFAVGDGRRYYGNAAESNVLAECQPMDFAPLGDSTRIAERTREGISRR
jgi:hypothetical protein